MTFDPIAELTALRQQTAAKRRRRYATSRLDRHAGELLRLYRAGASAAELQRWLAGTHRLLVAHSTVTRWLSRQDSKKALLLAARSS